jgi:hypothetical protein
VELFRRRPRYVPLVVPRLDGTTWPDRATLGRPSFDALTFYDLGYREAFEPEAHDIADLLVEAVLRRVPARVSAEDEPYLMRVFVNAARIGAGIGIVERKIEKPGDQMMDRRVCGALWQARRELPAMQGDWAQVAQYLLLAGYYVARHDPGGIPALVERMSPEGA